MLAHASMVAQEEGESAVDSIHIRRALLALRGIGAQPEGSLLSKLGLNLIEQAQAGNLPPVVGRDAEISQLVEILCRPIIPYAVLVGAEGVGRRTVVHGLAEWIAKSKVPEALQNRPLISLPQIFDHPSFYAAIVEEASQKNVILYIEPF